MLQDEYKLRLITAAVKLQDIIASLDIDLEYQALSDLYGSGTKKLQYGVETLEDANAKLQVAGYVTLQSRLDDNGYLFASLNRTISDVGKLVDRINNPN